MNLNEFQELKELLIPEIHSSCVEFKCVFTTFKFLHPSFPKNLETFLCTPALNITHLVN